MTRIFARRRVFYEPGQSPENSENPRYELVELFALSNVNPED
ncbi:hypothetical protein [Devriesea agamarum]|nr:hypothetical protein [Devriesea agamarum]